MQFHPTSFRLCLVGFRGQRMQLAAETAVTALVNFFIKFLKITQEQPTQTRTVLGSNRVKIFQSKGFFTEQFLIYNRILYTNYTYIDIFPAHVTSP